MSKFSVDEIIARSSQDRVLRDIYGAMRTQLGEAAVQCDGVERENEQLRTEIRLLLRQCDILRAEASNLAAEGAMLDERAQKQELANATTE